MNQTEIVERYLRVASQLSDLSKLVTLLAKQVSGLQVFADAPPPVVEPPSPPPSPPAPAPGTIDPPAPPPVADPPAPQVPPAATDSPPSFMRPGSPRSVFNIRPTNPVLGAYVLPPSAIPPEQGGPWFPVIGAGNLSTKVRAVRDTDPPVRVFPSASGLYLSSPQSSPDHVDFAHWPFKDHADLGTDGGGDGHADMIDVAGNLITSFYNLREEKGVWTAQVIAPVPLDGTLVEDGPRAVGCPSCAGIIRRLELADTADVFPHVLAMTLPREAVAKHFLPPFTKQDNDAQSVNLGEIPEGALMMLPASFDVGSIRNPFIAKVCRTLMLYGARVVDKNYGTPFGIYIENATDEAEAAAIPIPIHDVPGGWSGLDSEDLRAIEHALRQVVKVDGWIDATGAAFDFPYPLTLDAPAPPVIVTPAVMRPSRDTLAKRTRLHYYFPAVKEADLAALETSFPDPTPDDLSDDPWGDQSQHEENPGYQPAIGLVTRSAAIFLMHPDDPRALANARANAHTSSAHPVHYKDPETGGWMRPVERNAFKSLVYSHRGDYAIRADKDFGNANISVDVAHQPHFLYPWAVYCGERLLQLGPIATGEPADVAAERADLAAELAYCLNEMEAWCSFNFILSRDEARGYGLGLFYPMNSMYQSRGAGWGLLALAQFVHVATVYAPDHAGLADWKRCLENNLRFLDGCYRTGTFDMSVFSGGYVPTIPFPNDQGIMCGQLNPPDDKDVESFRGFMQAFQTQSVLWIIAIAPDLQLADDITASLPAFTTWLCRWPAQHLGALDTPGQWDGRLGGTYDEPGGRRNTKGGIDFMSRADAYEYMFGGRPTLTRQAFYHDAQNVDYFHGGYNDNLLPACALGAQLGDPDCIAAWKRIATLEQMIKPYETSGQQFGPGGAYQFGLGPPGFFVPAAQSLPPAPAPQPAPNPAPAPTPAPVVSFDAAKAVRVVGENEKFRLIKAGTVWYGGTAKGTSAFIQRSLPPGEYTADNALFGDPLLGVVKALYVMDATIVDASYQTAPAPSPAPAPQPAPAPLPAGTPPASEIPSPFPLPPAGWKELPYEPTTTFVDDDADVSPNKRGSWITMPRIAGERHSIARPRPFIDLSKRVEVATPAGTGWRELPNTSFAGMGDWAGMGQWTGWGWNEQLRLAGGAVGGGHAGGNDAGWVGFDDITLKAIRFFGNRPLNPVPGPFDQGGDLSPGPDYEKCVHSYYGQLGVVDPRDNKPKFWNVSHATNRVGILDPIAGTYEKGATYVIGYVPGKKIPDFAENTTGQAAVFDPKRRVVFYRTGGRPGRLVMFDFERNRWFQIGYARDNGGYVGMALDTKRDRIITMSDLDGVGIIELSALQSGFVEEVGGKEHPSYRNPDGSSKYYREWKDDKGNVIDRRSGSMTFAYDEDQDDFLIYSRDLSTTAFPGLMQRMDPVTFEITTLSNNGPSPNGNGTYGRFWKSRARNEWFTVPDDRQNFWSFRR